MSSSSSNWSMHGCWEQTWCQCMRNSIWQGLLTYIPGLQLIETQWQKQVESFYRCRKLSPVTENTEFCYCHNQENAEPMWTHVSERNLQLVWEFVPGLLNYFKKEYWHNPIAIIFPSLTYACNENFNLQMAENWSLN